MAIGGIGINGWMHWVLLSKLENAHAMPILG